MSVTAVGAALTSRQISGRRPPAAAARVAALGDPPTTAGSVRARKAWEVVEGDDSGVEELVTDAWAFIGRARSHTATITGLAFAPLPPAAAVAPGTAAALASWRGGAEGLESDRFWDPATVQVAPAPDDSGGAVSALLLQHASWGLCVLASVGADKRVVLYDVGGSSVTGGLSVLGNHRTCIEQWATPTACVWLSGADAGNVPASATGAPHILTSNNHFKLKLWSVTPKPACRRTALAPTFGGSVTQLVPMIPPPSGQRGDNAEDFTPTLRDSEANARPSISPSVPDGAGGRAVAALAFATDDRVVGLIATPLDGNPYSFVGVVAHPGPVTGLSVSPDCRYLFSCGLDTDLDGTPIEAYDPASGAAGSGSGSVCIWSVDLDSLATQLASGGTGTAPFLTLLEGGGEGAQYQAVCDMFSYAQIRSQGESSTAQRRAGITLPLSELPAVMRALGFHPTAAEIAALNNEARSLQALESVPRVTSRAQLLPSVGEAEAALQAYTGGWAAASDATTASSGESVTLPTLLRLYVNHRPVLPLARDSVLRSVSTASALGGEAAGGGLDVRWGLLSSLLSSRAEKLAGSELLACLTALMGPLQGGASQQHIGDEEILSGEDFADRVLGMPA